jgi:hypothetical protein
MTAPTDLSTIPLRSPGTSPPLTADHDVAEGAARADHRRGRGRADRVGVRRGERGHGRVAALERITEGGGVGGRAGDVADAREDGVGAAEAHDRIAPRHEAGGDPAAGPAACAKDEDLHGTLPDRVAGITQVRRKQARKYAPEGYRPWTPSSRRTATTARSRRRCASSAASGACSCCSAWARPGRCGTARDRFRRCPRGRSCQRSLSGVQSV